MPSNRQRLSELLLRSPAPVRALRSVPILGSLIHAISHRIVPDDEKVWSKIEAGPAQGIWMELNPRTGQLYLRGEVEKLIQQILLERLRPGMVFYDLGANVGLFSLLAARLVGLNGRVFSFEPDPDTATRLERNIARNGYQNTNVIRAGVSSTTGSRMFEVADASSPDHGVGKFVAAAENGNGISVDCIALDDFVRDAAPPDIIKCDVEGSEVEVLRGAEKLLSEHRPSIVCELHSERNRTMVMDILTRFGYRVESVDANHVLAMPNLT